jgi:predicted ATP-binding protein involved in virulence
LFCKENKFIGMDSIQKIHNDLFEHLRTKYPELRFKLRQSNRYNRLDQGFWFLGNNGYLGTSFWEGMDWQNKTPNIMLGVDLSNSKKPKLYLEFVANDNEKKADFFSKIALPLQMNRLKKSGKEINKWMKFYENENFLEAVDRFIEHDKTIIDAFINVNKDEKLFPLIEENEFRERSTRVRGLKILAKIDNANLNDLNRNWRIERMKLQNIAQFLKVEILFDPRVTCFIGENGSGKTTVLRAILLGLIGVDQNEYLKENNHLTNSLINLLKIRGAKKNEIDYLENGRIELLTSKQNEPSVINFSWSSQGRPVIQDEGSSWEIDENGNLSILVMGFSQIQGVPNKAQVRTSLKPNVADVLPLLANEPDGRGEALQKWLLALDHDASNKERQGQTSAERELINRMFKIISDVTGQKLSLSAINAQKEIIWIELDGQTIPLGLVSQGFNNVFSWVGYFMKRLSETAPEGTEDPTQLPAICLIDEIDTYLHPLWQQTIVPALVKHFPKTQFIITTHSPIVVSNMEHGKLYKLENGEAIEIPKGYFGREYGLTLESVMDAPSRNEKVQAELDALFELIDKDKYEAAQKVLQELAKKYPNEPELSRAETMLALLTE